MPGISLICDFKKNLKQDVILKTLDNLIYDKDYYYQILINENQFIVSCTKYLEYPTHVFENDDFYFFIEGRIYNKNEYNIKIELSSLAKSIFNDNYNYKEYLKKWILDTDGDFIIFILHKSSNKMIIFNDSFGRLPLYYYYLGGKFLISREIRFIASLVNNIEIDNMGVALFLLFGYTMGERTLLKDVKYLEPATLLKIDPNISEITKVNIYKYNFEIKINKNKKIDNCADDLASLFIQACKNREQSDYKNVIGLSGGLDSRAVAAGLYKSKIPIYAATRLSYDKNEQIDVNIAKEIANTLNINWQLFNCEPNKGSDYLKLLNMKLGLVPLSISFIIPFLNNVKNFYGNNIVYFTGDGGDRIKPTLKPLKKLKNLDDLVNYIISSNFIFSLNDVSKLVNIAQHEIYEEIKNIVISYPETDLYQKYVHFMIYESAFKRVFEGEDKNRFYFWSVTPFYSIHFFNYAMNCTDKMKSHYKLYKKFLIKLSPQISYIKNANWGLPITSKKIYFYLIEYYLYKNLPSKFKKTLDLKLKKRFSLFNEVKTNDLINCFWDQINNCNYINKYISINYLKDFESVNKTPFFNLFTINSVIEKILCNRSVFDIYYDKDLVF